MRMCPWGQTEAAHRQQGLLPELRMSGPLMAGEAFLQRSPAQGRHVATASATAALKRARRQHGEQSSTEVARRREVLGANKYEVK